LILAEVLSEPAAVGAVPNVMAGAAVDYNRRYRLFDKWPDWYQHVVPVGGGSMAITASEARKHLFPLIEQVNEDRTPVEITSRRGDAVLLSREEYDALQETAHLLRAPKNARRLLESLDQALAGKREEHELQR
jgi:antitoxin YefM